MEATVESKPNSVSSWKGVLYQRDIFFSQWERIVICKNSLVSLETWAYVTFCKIKGYIIKPPCLAPGTMWNYPFWLKIPTLLCLAVKNLPQAGALGQQTGELNKLLNGLIKCSDLYLFPVNYFSLMGRLLENPWYWYS